MGCFDEVIVDCPRCNDGFASFQSKAGECRMKAYSIQSVPPAIAADIGEEVQSCEHCGAQIRLSFQIIVIPQISIDSSD